MATPTATTLAGVAKALVPSLIPIVVTSILSQLGLRQSIVVLAVLVGAGLVLGCLLPGCSRRFRIIAVGSYGLLTLAVILTFWCVEAWQPKAQVELDVTDSDGKPYADKVDVTLFPPRPKEVGQAAAADDRGHVRFRGLHAQDYYLLLYRIQDDRLLIAEFVAQATEKQDAESLPCRFPAHESRLDEFPKIYFQEGDASLSDETQLIVLEIARVMLGCDSRLLIQGHCSMTGSAQRNFELGALRALTVADALVRAGARPERLMIVSFGKNKPVVRGTSAKENQQNQRVETLLLPRNENFEKFVARANAAQAGCPQMAESKDGGEGDSLVFRLPDIGGDVQGPVTLSLPQGRNVQAAQ